MNWPADLQIQPAVRFALRKQSPGFKIFPVLHSPFIYASALLALLVLPLPAVNVEPFPQPPSKKGLQVQIVPDAVDLGIRHASYNITVPTLLDTENAPDAIVHPLGGKIWRFKRRAVEAHDRRIKVLTSEGITVYLILLGVQKGNPPAPLFLHPGAAHDQGWNIAAYNTETPEGSAAYEAVVDFLAGRYSAPHNHQGRVWGYIVGNEVNCHFLWYRMGPSTAEEVATRYEQTVRLTHDIIRRHSAHARVYLSLDHHWGARVPGTSDRDSCAGRELIDHFARIARHRGDYAWHIAYHPYPDDLANPRTWLDKDAPPHENATHITFKNLEVLPRYLERPELLWQGQPRRVILSEQGFNCLPVPEGETLQAAAYAYAWEKVMRAPGVDAFILHRHVDHAHEVGLNLGLWSKAEGSVNSPGNKRLMHRVFQAAGTRRWAEESSFALPVTGLRSWDELDQGNNPEGARKKRR